MNSDVILEVRCLAQGLAQRRRSANSPHDDGVAAGSGWYSLTSGPASSCLRLAPGALPPSVFATLRAPHLCPVSSQPHHEPQQLTSAALGPGFVRRRLSGSQGPWGMNRP